jgi:hypothetical protein
MVEIETEGHVEPEKKMDVVVVANQMYDTFVNRDDCYAMQLKNGAYYCVRRPLLPGVIADHLLGHITVATYTLSEQSTAKFTALDADTDEDFYKLCRVFEKLPYPSYLEASRRGGHLWFFFEKPIAGKNARNFGLEVAKLYGVEAEVFPKQTITKGPGSCIRLPFGIHRKTGDRYAFAGFCQNQDMIDTVVNPVKIPLEEVLKCQYKEPVKIKKEHPTESPFIDLPLWEKIKRQITVRELVERYVDLDAKGKGKCPFHDDDSPSLSVNERENYWNCFAGCGGGSVIDFWMKLNHMEFNEAVEDLAERLKHGWRDPDNS